MPRALTASRGLRSDARYWATLERSVFRSWLKSHFYQVVGLASIGDACPLARCLSQGQGIPYVVGIDCYWPAGTGLLRPLPCWGTVFLNRLERLYQGCPVMGAQALEILDRVR